MGDNNLNMRLFNFTVKTLKFIGKLPETPEFKIIRYQLAKSGTSSGANYEEAQAGSSRADFNNKVRISLREMRESNYWFRLIYSTYDDFKENEDLNWLINESKELKNILGTIVNKTKKGT